MRSHAQDMPSARPTSLPLEARPSHLQPTVQRIEEVEEMDATSPSTVSSAPESVLSSRNSIVEEGDDENVPPAANAGK